MTLDEAFSAKELLVYDGFKYVPCGPLTGRYFIDNCPILNQGDEKYTKVEVKCGILNLSRKWVHLSSIREIKDLK